MEEIIKSKKWEKHYSENTKNESRKAYHAGRSVAFKISLELINNL